MGASIWLESLLSGGICQPILPVNRKKRRADNAILNGNTQSGREEEVEAVEEEEGEGYCCEDTVSRDRG